MLYLNYNNNLISFDLITILYNSILDIISLYIYIYGMLTFLVVILSLTIYVTGMNPSF